MSSRYNPEDFLAVDKVRFTYPGAARPALDGADLKVAKDTVHGVLGPNGAGKTTLVSMLCSLIAPESGTIHLAGRDLVRAGAEVRRMIGIVPQEIAVYQEFSPRENLEFFGRLYGLSGACLRERVDECLERAGLSGRSGQRVHTFSGGMKRRVNLACGLVHRPDLLILDEPTVGIDAQSREMILEWLAELPAAGTTLIYTTHYMEEAQRLCDRITVLDQGRVICEGVPDELLAARGYASLGDLFFSLTGRGLKD